MRGKNRSGNDIPGDVCLKVKDVVKYNFYYPYFKENFNYSCGGPQVDVCSQRESLSTKIKDPILCENAKRNVAAELMIHKRRAKKLSTVGIKNSV